MATQQPAPPPGTVYCRECGKAIESGARFCRFCGKSQADRPGATPVAAGAASRPSSAASPTSRPAPRPSTGEGLETWLRRLFPRHQLQDEFMHVGSIAVFLLALIGFVLGFFYSFNFLAVNFLLASVALSLFLMLRESTLSRIHADEGEARSPVSPRNPAGRAIASGSLPAEAATTQSSPPTTGRPAGQK